LDLETARPLTHTFHSTCEVSAPFSVMMSRLISSLVVLLAVSASAFTLPAATRSATTQTRTTTPKAVLNEFPLTLLAEIVDTTGERVYGAVDAPGWVIPVGGALAIATALLPVLLAPGEQAFQRQQGDEKKVKNEFGNNIFKCGSGLEPRSSGFRPALSS
jgi:hypothetical protein